MITRFLSLIFFFVFSISSAAIPGISKDTTSTDTTIVKNERITYWTKVNKAGFNLNEVTFINWSAGGNNSVSGLLHALFSRKYKKELLNWESNLSIKYGLNAQEGRELR